MIMDCEAKMAEFKGHEEKLKARILSLESDREGIRKDIEKYKELVRLKDR